MAAHPLHSRGSNRLPKRPNTQPFDRGRIVELEQFRTTAEAQLAELTASEEGGGGGA